MNILPTDEVEVGNRIINQLNNNTIIISTVIEVCIEDNCVIVEGGMDIQPVDGDNYVVLNED